MFFSPLAVDEVSTIIRELKDEKAIRSNDINLDFLIVGNIILAPYLSTLFKHCSKKGVYPDGLKVAEVVPIFKKGDPNDVTNYRPIFLLSNFNKIFEKLVYHRLNHFLKKYNFLRNYQYGFRSNSSTTFALCDIYYFLLKNIYQNLIKRGLFLDQSIAFDTVDLKILVKKLGKNFGIRSITLALLKSYLTNRLRYTKDNGSCSSTQSITWGVPQGSTLCSLLFAMYVNDLPLFTKFSVTLYAEETYLMLSDNYLGSLEKNENVELEKINYWMRANKLSLNYSKTNYMLIYKKSWTKFPILSLMSIWTKI